MATWRKSLEKWARSCRESSAIRHREETTRTHLETENELLRKQLKEKETQVACMVS